MVVLQADCSGHVSTKVDLGERVGLYFPVFFGVSDFRKLQALVFAFAEIQRASLPFVRLQEIGIVVLYTLSK